MECTYSNDPHFLKALHTYWFRYLLAERRPMLNIRIKEIIEEQTKKNHHKAPYISPGGHGCPHDQT
jgi:hypothetical protein